MKRTTLILPLVILGYSVGAMAGVPVIYSTDLYHPHDDPDDHFDLATLYALPELDIKGIIIDMSNIGEKRDYQTTPKKPGIVALRQMSQLTGNNPPSTTGLERPLSSLEDTAIDQPESSQGGVKMILSILRSSPEKVSIFTVGSLVDLAAAYNREPDLLRRKVRAIYVNAGTGPDGFQKEWNVRLDPNAFSRILLSDLPVEWYPCFGRDSFFTHFRVDQTEVLSSAPAPLRAFFAYALQHSTEDPIPFLAGNYPPPEGFRNMWCTASFVDLAGRKVYKTSNGFEALANPPDPDSKAIMCYEMQPVRLSQGDPPPGQASPDDSGFPFFQAERGEEDCNIRVIRKGEPKYSEVMTFVLKNLLSEK